MLRDHRFFRKLLSLGFPPEDYVIAGSGPLLAHGIRRDIGDIDVVARGVAWELAAKWGAPQQAPFGWAQHVVLFDGSIEVLNGWFDYSVDSLIMEAEIFEGMRFMPLERVAEWKVRLLDGGAGRDSDLRDIALIKNYLK
ncbi:hypothetical protein ACH492_30375 [Streptomyces sp. NPDC019443]|uniref:hypothetical protein n=1 Tax=Streptomyces sp. NPDC019443 TaxID=3365061 RepID=UPI0037B5D5B0